MLPEGSAGSPNNGAGALSRARGGGKAQAVVGFVLGMMLLGVAIWVVRTQGTTLHDGMQAITQAPAWAILLSLGLYLLNFVFASASFWVLTNRYGRVKYEEMFGLIAGATLFNYLPLRPGMLARVAYHKRVHGIAVRDSLKVLFGAVCCAGAAMGSLVLAAWGAHGLGLGVGAAVAMMLVPVAVAAVAAGLMRDWGQVWRWPAAAAFRYLDMCVWTGRYALIFWMLGRPMTPPSAAAVAFSSQVAMMSPVQLGLREWVVGTAASVVSGQASSGRLGLPESLASLAPGLLADIINRAAEFSVAIPLGIVGTLVLAVRFRRNRLGTTECANPPGGSAL